MDWLTEPGIAAGKRNAPVEQARVPLPVFAAYEDCWDFLRVDEPAVPVMPPKRFRALAHEKRVGLPEGDAWANKLPIW
jgi:hypothetical protein